jgi:hypothetical protein
MDRRHVWRGMGAYPIYTNVRFSLDYYVLLAVMGIAFRTSLSRKADAKQNSDFRGGTSLWLVATLLPLAVRSALASRLLLIQHILTDCPMSRLPSTLLTLPDLRRDARIGQDRGILCPHPEAG